MLSYLKLITLLFVFLIFLNSTLSSLENYDRDAGLITFKLEVSEVTTPDIAISPDGKTIVFTILGHLFILPIDGGSAEQLTFGPNYNHEPSFAPDGRKIAFVSDRDSTDGNIFILNLETKEISQITHTTFTGYPSWSPDGKNILFLEYDDGPRRVCPGLSVVKSINLSNNQVSSLTEDYAKVTSIFYLQDSKPGWSVMFIDGFDKDLSHEIYQSALLTIGKNEKIDTLKTIKWTRENIAFDPSENGLYCIKRKPGSTKSTISFVSLKSMQAIDITEIPLGTCSSKFDVLNKENNIIIGYNGGLWKVSKNGKNITPIPFTAEISLTVNPKISPVIFNIDDNKKVSTILSPRLSDDRTLLIFGAMGHLWKHDLITGKSNQITSGNGLYRKSALSKNGENLAYAKSINHSPQIRLLNFVTGEDSLISTGKYFWDLTWHPETNILYWAEGDWDGIHIYSWNPITHLKDTVLSSVSRKFPPRPHFSINGKYMFFRQDSSNKAFLKRLSLNSDKEIKTIAKVANNISNILISPDQKWIAFRRNSELWLKPFAEQSNYNNKINELEAEFISPYGGRSFSFTFDGADLIYSEQNRVFLYSLAEHTTKEIPVSFNTISALQNTVILRNVYLLKDDIKDFSLLTNLAIENGRITWIGANEDLKPLQGVKIIDAKGRFVTPGLIDAHIHVEAPWWYKDVDQTAYIAYGVTTVRDMGESISWVKSLADRSKLTNDPIPRYAYPGNLFQGKYDNLSESFTLIRSKSQIETEVKRHYNSGVQFIKSYADLSWNFHLEIVKEARKLSLPIAAHGSNVKEIVRGITQGYTFLEHLDVFSSYNEDIYKLMMAGDVYWTPTLNIMWGNKYLLVSEKERLEDKKFCAFFPDECGQTRWNNRTGFFKGLQEIQLETLSKARRYGVNVLLGTDTPFTPGVSMHTELEAYVLAGFSPYEALNLATLKNAKALGIDHDLGAIQVGKLADLIILNENPLKDIRNTQKIWRVIKGGAVFDPEKLIPQ